MECHERIRLIIILPLIIIIHVAGCDIDFGGSDDDGDLTTDSVLSGQIDDIDSGADREGVTVSLEDENSDSEYSDITGSSGSFEIIGGFCGTSIVTLTDSEGDQLAIFSVEILPGSDTDIGGLTISDRSVIFEDDIITEFIGDVIENDCDGNSGTLTVEINHDCDVVEVLVTVDRSTDVTDDDNDIDCEDLEIGTEILIDSVMNFGNSVDAFDIEVTDD